MQEEILDILGDYKILKKIGEGTLGSLYLAEHRFIKKQYMLKVLPPELCQDAGFMQRFEEEVIRLASLDHPHIVKTHNVSFSNGVYFLTTDCISDSLGETCNLAQYMAGRKQRLEEELLLNMIQQIADALDYAHLKGQVVHRALKLNNILLDKTQRGLHVYISDFGLSKILTPGKTILRTFKAVAEAVADLPQDEHKEEKYTSAPIKAEHASTLSQVFLQAYAFLAPEQKKFEHVGVTADTYAFGVLIYYLISGRFPEGNYELPSKIAPEYVYDWDHLVSLCLQQDALKRPTQLIPLLQKKREAKTFDSVSQPRQVQDEKKEPSVAIEQLKKTLSQVVLQPREELVEALAYAAPSPSIVRVETRDVVEATALPMTPASKEEKRYSDSLNAMMNRDPVVTHYNPEKRETRVIEPIYTEMSIIEGGRFLRGCKEGSRDEQPCHKIFLDSFAIDIHPVTNEQFVRFLEFTGGEKDQNYHDLIRLKDSRINRIGGKLSIESGYSKHPVVGVTWYGAGAYARWIGKRLPTEAEWEIAARGGLENYLYPTGDSIEKSQANFFSSDTTSVMSYAPNKFGLYDMSGNVYEWCEDWYGYNYYETSAQEPNNPKGPPQGVYRVLRGGCWKSLKEDMRCAHRHRNNPGTVNSTYGFRCAANVK